MANRFQQFIPQEEERKENRFSQFIPQVQPQPQEEDQSILSSAGSTISEGWEALPEPVTDTAEFLAGPVVSAGKMAGGGIMSALRQLGRPQSAIAGGIHNIVDEYRRPDDPSDDRSLWDKYATETLQDMKKGFTYEDEKRIQDVIALADPEWVKEHPIWSTVLGFAGDVVTDPLNLVGVGLLRHGISVPVKALNKAIAATAPGRALMAAADNPVLRAFNVYTGDKKKARELYVQYLDNVRGAHGKISRGRDIEKKDLKEAASKLGVSVDDLERQIIREAEGGAIAATAKGLPADLKGPALAKAKEEAEDVTNIMKGFLFIEGSSVPIRGMGEGARVIASDIGDVAARSGDLGIDGYIPHILSEAGRKTAEKNVSGTLRDVYRTHPSMIQRQKAGTVETNNLKHGEDYFITDFPTIKAVREARHAQVVAGTNFLKETAETLGRPVGSAGTDGWVPLAGIEGVVFDPGVADMVKGMAKTIRDPKEMGKYMKYVDGATRWWKMWSLGLRPAYHSRNVVGNIWNAYHIGGMSNPIYFGKAMQIQRDATRKGGAEAITGKVHLGKYNGGKAVDRDVIWKEAMEDGVFNHGQYTDDLIANVQDYAVQSAPKNAKQSLAQWVTPSTKNRLLQGGFATGKALENNARLALYMDTLAKTGSRSAARANVKKALFDYSDLSDFEQDVMKRLMPFYTWSRKNIPAQIEAMLKNPQRTAKVHHMIDNIQYGVDTPSLDEVSEFVAGRNPVFIDKFFKSEGGEEDVHNVMTLMNWLPLTDPDRLLDWKPIREGKAGSTGIPFPSLVAEMTNPYLKAVFESVVNYDIYRRRDIEDYKGQTVDFLGVKMNPYYAKLAQNLIMLSEFDRLNVNEVFGERSRDESGNMVSTPAKFTPPWQSEPSMRESRTDLPMSQRLLQYLVGLRPYEAKVDRKKWEKLAIRKDFRELRSKLRSALRTGRVQQSQEIRESLRRMQRVMGDLQ